MAPRHEKANVWEKQGYHSWLLLLRTHSRAAGNVNQSQFRQHKTLNSLSHLTAPTVRHSDSATNWSATQSAPQITLGSCSECIPRIAPHLLQYILLSSAKLMEGLPLDCKISPTSLQTCTHLTNPGNSCHPAVTVGCSLFLALLGKEKVDLIIITSAAAQTLPHKRWAHEVSLCKLEKRRTD